MNSIPKIAGLILSLILLSSCANAGVQGSKPIINGAAQITDWLHLLDGKRVGLLVNHTSLVNNIHLLDTLLASGVNVKKVFVPEHGFRGDADAGEHVKDGVDTRTGIPIISLYGAIKKPTPAHLQNLDIVIFDIQDVGVRFYTYISSMHYMMEACAENGLPLIVLDRPNPNGDYFDGPILQPGFRSFVGMHPIPLVHGLTVGELALMINGEGWLANREKAELTVIPVKNYRRDMRYSLPLPPSPNLPNDLSIRLYPSLCLFEATEVSIGRGTLFPFQVAGYPNPKFGSFTFTPVSIRGMATRPLQENNKCHGIDLRDLYPWDQRFTLKYFIKFFEISGRDPKFVSRRRFFNLLAGTDQLLKQIEAGLTEEQIRATWQPGLEAFGVMRQKYLLYP